MPINILKKKVTDGRGSLIRKGWKNMWKAVLDAWRNRIETSKREDKYLHRITQDTIAEAFGISQSNVSLYMRGRLVPTSHRVEEFYGLCRELGLLLDNH